MHPSVESFIKKHYGKYHLKPFKSGASGAKLYALSCNESVENDLVLKVVSLDSEKESQKNEVAYYRWLENKVPVPKIHHFEQVVEKGELTTEILVMSHLKGFDLKSKSMHYDPSLLAKQYGSFLGRLHQLPIQGCPVSVPLPQKIEQAKWYMENGQVDESDFEGIYQGIPAQALFKRLLKEVPASTDLVVTHGDYCLDNLIVQETESGLTLSGFIDLGMGGVQDRYQDLALAVRSLRKRIGHEYVADFIRGYGLLKELDESKIDYYIMMDEFF